VARLFLDGGTVIRKEPVGPDARRRLVREVAMLQRLRGVVGVAQLLPAPRYPGSVVEGCHENRGLLPSSTSVRLLNLPCLPRGGPLSAVAGVRTGAGMELVHPRCAGLDVSKRDAKVCVRIAGAAGPRRPRR